MSESNKYLFTLDIGNTNPHIGIFENESLKEILSMNDFQKSSYFKNKKGDIVISSVTQDQDLLDYPQEKIFNLTQVRKDNLFLDMPVDYSPTLGIDRLVTGLGAFSILKEKKIKRAVVIDAGTFITCDLIDHEKGFLGGHIIPGISGLLSLSKRGANLPELEKKEFIQRLDKLNSLPKNTEDALYGAVARMLSGYFNEFINENGPIQQVLITGGGSTIVERLINQKDNLVVDAEFIHKSMFKIHKHLFVTR